MGSAHTTTSQPSRYGQPVLEQYGALIAARLQQQRDPAWLKALRAAAANRLQERGLPGKKWESWHYSAADLWLHQFSEQFALAPIAPDADSARFAGELPKGHRIHFNHGYLVDQHVEHDDRDKFCLLPLAQLDTVEHAALIEWLGATQHADPLADLATALAPETWVLIVRPGVRLRHPIFVSHLATRPGSHIGQLLVWAQAGAEATLIEHFAAARDVGTYLHSAHTALKLDANSRLIYARINRDGAAAQHLGVFEAELARDARLQLQVLESASGPALANKVRNGIYVRLHEPNAEFVARGAFAATDTQHIDYHFTVEHRSDHGRSDILMQGLAANRSRGVINGRIYIAQGTRANDGHFTTHNLLLSNDAEIDAKPELEIYADEVSCAHGATVGQLDDEQLLYLQTRGVDRAAAIALLTEGFLKAGLLDCSNNALNEFLLQQLLVAMPAAPGSSEAAV
jgi:Fe-S cluster assembly protein SufD